MLIDTNSSTVLAGHQSAYTALGLPYGGSTKFRSSYGDPYENCSTPENHCSSCCSCLTCATFPLFALATAGFKDRYRTGFVLHYNSRRIKIALDGRAAVEGPGLSPMFTRYTSRRGLLEWRSAPTWLDNAIADLATPDTSGSAHGMVAAAAR